jgi:hypothetical protein
VIRISPIEWVECDVALRVEGRLTRADVEILCRSCEGALALGQRLVLDLSDLRFASDEGRALLRRLAERGVRLVAWPPYLVEGSDG